MLGSLAKAGQAVPARDVRKARPAPVVADHGGDELPFGAPASLPAG